METGAGRRARAAGAAYVPTALVLSLNAVPSTRAAGRVTPSARRLNGRYRLRATRVGLFHRPSDFAVQAIGRVRRVR